MIISEKIEFVQALRNNPQIQVWGFDDPAVPKPIKHEAFRGGDEDYIVAGPASDEELFFTLCDFLDDYQANRINRDHVSRFEYNGVPYLVHTICHA